MPETDGDYQQGYSEDRAAYGQARLGERRTLATGDRIAAYPCVVTITHLGNLQSVGACESCQVAHVIDRTRYEVGLGPWHPALSTRTGDTDAR